MTTEEKIEAIGAYGYGVYSFPGGFAIADPEDGEEGWYFTTEPGFPDGTQFGPYALDELLDETIEMIQAGAYEGPLGLDENKPENWVR